MAPCMGTLAKSRNEFFLFTRPFDEDGDVDHRGNDIDSDGGLHRYPDKSQYSIHGSLPVVKRVLTQRDIQQMHVVLDSGRFDHDIRRDAKCGDDRMMEVAQHFG